MNPTELSAWLLESTIILSVLLIVVLLVRLPVAQLLGARWAYVIWAIPFLRILFSLLPEPAQAGLIALTPSLRIGANLGVEQLTSATWIPAEWSSLLLSTWLVGVVLFALFTLIQQRRCRRTLESQSTALSREDVSRIESYCNQMQIFPAIRCRQSALIESPVLLGLWQPMLLLPTNFLQESPEPELVIRHELVHLKRRDLWHLALVSVVRCVFWFNPLVHLAARSFRTDQEVACDQSVIATEPRSRRYTYGLAMLNIAETKLPVGVAFMSSEPLLKRRARMLAHHRQGLLQNTGGATVILALALIGATFGTDATLASDWNTALTFPMPVPGTCE